MSKSIWVDSCPRGGTVGAEPHHSRFTNVSRFHASQGEDLVAKGLQEPSGASNQRWREPSEDTEGSRRSSQTQLPNTRLETLGIREDPTWPSEWARPSGGVEGHDPGKKGPRSPIFIIRRFRDRMSLVSSCFCPFQLRWFIILCWELMPSRVSCWFYCSSNRALLLYSLCQQKNATMGACQVK
jgi:hypothetical protein